MTTIEKEKLDKKNTKNTEELVKQIKLLTKQFAEIGKDKNISQKGSGLKGAILGNIKERFGIPTSKAGVLDALSQKMGGGIMSTVLSAGAERIREKQTARDEKAKWAQGWLSGTDKGRDAIKEHGPEKAAKMALEQHSAKLRVENDISAVEEKRQTLKDSGVEGADLDQKELDRLDQKKKQLSGINGKVDKKTSSASKGNLPASVTAPPDISPVDQLKSEVLERTRAEAEKSGMTPEVQKEFMDGVNKGIDEELLKLNEEQLETLKKILAASVQSEEDSFEKKKNATNEIIEGKKEKTAEKLDPDSKPKGILESVTDMFDIDIDRKNKRRGRKKPGVKNFLRRSMTNVGNVVKGVAAGAGNIAAGAGNVVKGVAAGAGNVVKGVAAGAGNIAAGAGNIAAGAGNIAAGAGNVVKGVAAGAGNVVKGGLRNLPGIGTLLGIGTAGYEAYGEYNDADEKVKRGEITTEQGNLDKNKAVAGGVGAAGGTIAGGMAGAKLGAMLGMFGGPVGMAVGGAIGGVAGGALGYWGGKELGKEGVEMATGTSKVEADSTNAVSNVRATGVPPTTAPYRAEQTAALVTKTEAAMEKVTNVINNQQSVPTIINNNSSNNTIMSARPDVRIKEPSFNRALRMNYVT